MENPRTNWNGRHHLRGAAAIGLAIIMMSAGSPEARAAGLHGVGPVVGIGIDHEQVIFGIRFGAGELSNRLDLRPGVEVGIGDDHTRGAFLIDALYRFHELWDVWQPYAGGGLGLGVVSHDHRSDDDEMDVEPGLNIIGGVSKGVRSNDLFQAEIRIGIGEAPDLGFSVGWLFQ